MDVALSPFLAGYSNIKTEYFRTFKHDTKHDTYYLSYILSGDNESTVEFGRIDRDIENNATPEIIPYLVTSAIPPNK